MKNKTAQAIRLLIVVVISFFTSTCVNKIEDDTAELTLGNIPIKISTNILCLQSRVSNNQFEVDDAIGLYVLTESKKLDESRYVDNMRFTCTTEGLIPDKEVFYPAGNEKCDLIAYYPYQDKAIAADESSIDVSTKTNQNSPSGYSASDFVVAKNTGVSPSTQNVKLDFRHKFCQLSIAIQLTENDDAEDIKKNAIVSVNAYTEATYDFNDDTFSSLSTTKGITPNGEWIVNEETRKLTEKRVLLIPQQTDKCKISLTINGRRFSSTLPDGLLLESNRSSEVTLHFDSKTGISKLDFSIREWADGNSKDVTLEREDNANFVNIAELNFEQTGVYQVITESDTVIAEVCKEYLLGDNVDAQAIVLYPTATKNQGTVLQLLNTNNHIHGGDITWDLSSNSFTYIQGSSAPVTTLYVNTNGTIVFDKPAESQSVKAIGSKLNDTRGTEIKTYPIIKIGTQYWMGENLNTTKYNNGSTIAQITDVTKSTAGYFLKNSNRFYNEAAVLKGTLAPKGWKIPDSTEWGELEKYVNNTAAVLKAGTQWSASSGIDKANNKTGFNAQPIGFYAKIKDKNSSGYDFNGKYVTYWSAGGSQTSLAEKGLSLKFNMNEFGEASHNAYCGYSIRCIKE